MVVPWVSSSFDLQFFLWLPITYRRRWWNFLRQRQRQRQRQSYGLKWGPWRSTRQRQQSAISPWSAMKVSGILYSVHSFRCLNVGFDFMSSSLHGIRIDGVAVDLGARPNRIWLSMVSCRRRCHCHWPWRLPLLRVFVNAIVVWLIVAWLLLLSIDRVSMLLWFCCCCCGCCCVDFVKFCSRPWR
jgi:hypothetical protein